MSEKYTPSKGDYLNLKGKQYLPARRRVQWFRGEHPDWTIDTKVIELDFGAGYAVIRAEVLDDKGRLIAASLKTETRSDFGDFVEKAETGAIGRAVALAGFGTEDALDLDEGPAIADSPVERGPRPVTPADPRQRLAETAVAHGLTRAQLDGYADQVGVPKGERATPAQIEQIIQLIETPEVGLPTPPATPQESTPSGDQGSGQSTPPAATSVQPAGDSPPVSEPAAPSDAELLAAAGEGAELVPPRPGTDEYKALPDGNARSKAKGYWDKKEPAAPKGARETKEPEPISAGLT